MAATANGIIHEGVFGGALVRVVAQETPEPNVSVDRMMIGTPQPTVWVRCVFSLGPDLSGVSYHTDLTDHRGDRIATQSPQGCTVSPCARPTLQIEIGH